ncbi:hypothetical protein [Pyxidicoccus trucidator]|uniref:hypothetical protein n=1 Tax=Pyxidicoccus trucidator TaxID=2709662 RepID=UPI0013DA1E09|nr:hypothetical protein [Pyxidicoccus trucidator]
MITSLELLTPDECARLVAHIKELRAHWIPRGNNPQSTSFFTLGAAIYLDEPSEYRAVAERNNPLLREHFAWLYERLTEFLSRQLRAPVELAPGLGHPGFHVWLTPAIFTTPDASVHFDLQYLRAFPEPQPGMDFDRPLSFTLSLRLPRRGGGLNLWEFTYERYRQFYERINTRIQPKDVTVLLPRLRHPYTVGAIAMHSGHLLHQVGEVDQVFPGDERITLQGHGILVRGVWQLYF